MYASDAYYHEYKACTLPNYSSPFTHFLDGASTNLRLSKYPNSVLNVASQRSLGEKSRDDEIVRCSASNLSQSISFYWPGWQKRFWLGWGTFYPARHISDSVRPPHQPARTPWTPKLMNCKLEINLYVIEWSVAKNPLIKTRTRCDLRVKQEYSFITWKTGLSDASKSIVGIVVK